MPGVSTNVHISTCIEHIISIQPESVLDVGCGFGLWGFLCREYLDAWNSRIRPEEWTTRIDGIEIFEPYISDHQRALYSSITIADIREAAPTVDNYDLIITGDVIEHLPKSDAMDVLHTLYDRANKALMVNIPIGDTGWEQGEEYGNPAEEHLSVWEPVEFLPFTPLVHSYTLPCGDYATFCCYKNPNTEEYVLSRVQIAKYYEEKKQINRAITLAISALDLDPAEPDALTYTVNLMIGAGKIAEAVDRLERAIAINPSLHEAYTAAAKLLDAIGEHDRAREFLTKLLAQVNVSPELQAEARSLISQR